mmetsp:Transcript_23949/g.77262  ORF Transcript_23949/g.77262 Transcript_23949/m.77262 type:complete len:204 (+) Transcript_23949:758-1369(+)
MRHASSLKEASRPTTSSSSDPSADASPSSSCIASSGGPCRGSSKSHRFESSTRFANRSVEGRPPASTSSSHRSRSASTKSRSASAVAAERAPSIRTTPELCSSLASTEPRCASSALLALCRGLFAPFFLDAALPAGAAPLPKPAPLLCRPPFCFFATSAVPGCSSARSRSARRATASSCSRRRSAFVAASTIMQGSAARRRSS